LGFGLGVGVRVAPRVAQQRGHVGESAEEHERDLAPVVAALAYSGERELVPTPRVELLVGVRVRVRVGAGVGVGGSVRGWGWG